MAGLFERLRGGQTPPETTRLEPEATSYGRLTVVDRSLYRPAPPQDVDLSTESVLLGTELADVVGEVACNAKGSIIAARIPGSSLRDAHRVRSTRVDLTITKPFHGATSQSAEGTPEAMPFTGAIPMGDIDDETLDEVAGRYRDRLGLREQDLLVVGDFVTIGIDYPSVVKSGEEVPEDLDVLAIPQLLAEGGRIPLEPEDPKQVTVVYSRKFKYRK